MARGGYRPGAGRPPGSKKPKPIAAPVAAVVPQTEPAGPKKNPLEYMLSVMNDPTVSDERRDRLAIAAAPFVHARAGTEGKKEERAARAKAVGAGKFAPPAAPKLVVNNK